MRKSCENKSGNIHGSLINRQATVSWQVDWPNRDETIQIVRSRETFFREKMLNVRLVRILPLLKARLPQNVGKSIETPS